MKMPLLAAIDQGTSSSRFLVFDSANAELIESHQIEVTQIFPKPGWVEMDPNEIYSSVVECIEKVCEKLKKNSVNVSDIKAVGITNQRETIVAWDKETNEPLHNAIVWLDDRTSALAEEFSAKTPNQSKEFFKPISGLPIHPYFSALKIRWLLDNVPAVHQALKNGRLMLGTVDCWLLWKLCSVYATDVTNASRTNLLDLNKVEWSSELCDFYDIPKEVLPEVKSSAEAYGTFKSGSLKGIPVSGCLGDQQASLVGHVCLKSGEAKSTYGTGTFILCNTGEQSIQSKNGLLTTIAFQLGANSPVCYALEGSGSIGGTAVKFLRDNLGFIKNASDIERLAKSVTSTEGLFFVPCFTGLYTPYWDSSARGMLFGITQRTKPEHICLAALKAVCFQTAEMIEAIEKDVQASVTNLKVDGGMTANGLFNQLLADSLDAGIGLKVSNMTEVTGFGAAVSAGIGVGLITLQDIAKYPSKSEKYNSNVDSNSRLAELSRWKNVVKRVLSWTEP